MIIRVLIWSISIFRISTRKKSNMKEILMSFLSLFNSTILKISLILRLSISVWLRQSPRILKKLNRRIELLLIVKFKESYSIYWETPYKKNKWLNSLSLQLRKSIIDLSYTSVSLCFSFK